MPCPRVAVRVAQGPYTSARVTVLTIACVTVTASITYVTDPL